MIKNQAKKIYYSVGIFYGLMMPVLLMLPYYRAMSGYEYVSWAIIEPFHGVSELAYGLLITAILSGIIAIVGIAGVILNCNKLTAHKLGKAVSIIYGLLLVLPIIIFTVAFVSHVPWVGRNFAGRLNFSAIFPQTGFWANTCFAAILPVGASIFKQKQQRKTDKGLETKKAEYLKIRGSREYRAQCEIINACVQRVIAVWMKKNPLPEQYPAEGFEYVGGRVSKRINYRIITNKALDERKMARSLRRECINAGFDAYSTFGEDFSLDSCSKVAAQIIQCLSEMLPEDSRFILSEHLRSFLEV